MTGTGFGARMFERGRALVVATGVGLLLAGCAQIPQPKSAGIDPAAAALLQASARAHGAEAYAKLRDVNVSYDGEWYRLVQRFQPVLVDAAFRKRSEERLLVREGVTAQLHAGPGGSKFVVRRPGAVSVRYNGVPEADRERLDAAALVVDGYRLFLLGPLMLQERAVAAESAGEAEVEGRACDVVLVVLRPGFGVAAQDRVLAYIDRQDHLLRRIRFTIDGLASTRGAVVEVDLFDHVELAGVRWPTRFFERVLRPVVIDAHRWWITGLDVDRGYRAEAIAGDAFGGAAAAPARALAPGPAR